MTIAFLDDQLTGRTQARRSQRAHTTIMSARTGSPTRLRHGAEAAHPVVRAMRPSLSAVAAAAPAATVADGVEAARSKLRLTRRGRLVFGVLLVLLALTVFSLGRFTAGANASAPPLRVTVSSGDTLWSIAEQADPGSDPRDEVDRIVSANHLSTSNLVPGSVLVVPRG